MGSGTQSVGQSVGVYVCVSRESVSCTKYTYMLLWRQRRGRLGFSSLLLVVAIAQISQELLELKFLTQLKNNYVSNGCFLLLCEKNLPLPAAVVKLVHPTPMAQ